MLAWLRSWISPDASRTAEECVDLGNSHCAHGRLDDAERAYRDALRLRPGYANALNNLGSLLRDTGRIAEAERA